MSKRITNAIGIFLIVSRAAVGQAGQAQPAHARTSLSAESIPHEARNTIEAANSEWVSAMQRQDADAIARPYADDAIFVTASGGTARGRTAIARLMRDRFSQMGQVLSGRLAQDGIVRQGSSIYEWGHATLVVRAPDGRTSQSAGRYLTVWQQNPSGRWEIVRNLSLPE